MLAIVVLVGALVFTLSPVSVNSVNCGLPLSPQHIELTDGTNGETVTNSDCASAIDQRKTYSAGLGILGAILLIGALSNARWTRTPLHQLGRPVS